MARNERSPDGWQPKTLCPGAGQIGFGGRPTKSSQRGVVDLLASRPIGSTPGRPCKHSSMPER
uniref:Uncharacterized protein n=1 Tax=Romanomermis culicivorax TaxID=13658 RepID=A0A915HMT7_ROMCU